MAQAFGGNRRAVVVMGCAKTTTATWPGRGQSRCRLRCRRRCHRPALPLPGGIAGRFVILEGLGVRDAGSQVRVGEGQALSVGRGMRAGAAQESTGRQLARQRRRRRRLPSDGSRAVRRGPSRAGQSGAMHRVRREFHRVGSQVPIRGEIQLNRCKAGPRRGVRRPCGGTHPRRRLKPRGGSSRSRLHRRLRGRFRRTACAARRGSLRSGLRSPSRQLAPRGLQPPRGAGARPA